MTATAGPSTRVTRTPTPPLDGLSELLEHISLLRPDQIQEAESARAHASQRSSSDWVLAFSAFAEEAEALLNVSKDHLSGQDSRRGKDLLDKLIEVEETARYDHMLALALSEGRPPPPMPPHLRRRQRRSDLAGYHGTPTVEHAGSEPPRALQSGSSHHSTRPPNYDDAVPGSGDQHAAAQPRSYPSNRRDQLGHNSPYLVLRYLESLVFDGHEAGAATAADDGGYGSVDEDDNGSDDTGSDDNDSDDGGNDDGDDEDEDDGSGQSREYLDEAEARSTRSGEYPESEAGESFEYPVEGALESAGYAEGSASPNSRNPSEDGLSSVDSESEVPEMYERLSVAPRSQETSNGEVSLSYLSESIPGGFPTPPRSSRATSESPSPSGPYLLRYATTALEQVGHPVGKMLPLALGIPSSSPLPSPPSTSPLVKSDDVLCTICGDEINGTILFLGCGHTMDVPCIKKMFELASADEDYFPPRCCSIPIHLADVERYLEPPFVEYYLEKSREFLTKDRVYCYNKYCSAFLGPASDSSVTFRCPQCTYSTCAGCKGKVHRGAACDGPVADEGVLKLGEKQGWQRCVSCKYLVERVEGCPHITCRCGAQFCYLCGKEWSSACSSRCQRQ
ncbi:hypothetical protein C8Q78DRAFT_167871 [Trametes maxima]|nr:hypothetical protein C8Q78DRAFT_167871 [Trametes maxima]